MPQFSFVYSNIELKNHKVNYKKQQHVITEICLTSEQCQNIDIEHCDEIKIDNKMFDIISKKIENDSIKLLGHFDFEEDELINNILEKQTKKQTQKKNTLETQVLFFYENCNTVFYNNGFSFIQQYLFFSQKAFTQFSKIESPPPKFCFSIFNTNFYKNPYFH